MKLRNSRTQAPTLLFELEDELLLRMGRSQSVMEAIAQLQLWAGTDPYLIQLLSRQLIECLPLVTSGGEKQLVDELVQHKITEDWRQNTASVHLRHIESSLLGYPQIDSLLILYLKVLQRGETEVEGGPEQAVLIDSGLVVQDGNWLRVANAVYATVFDLDWIEQQVPGLTKPVSIVRSGVLPIEGSRRLDASPTSAGLDADLPRQLAPETKLYSKAMVLACCMAVAIAIFTTYTREYKQPSLAANANQADTLTETNATAYSADLAAVADTVSSDQQSSQQSFQQSFDSGSNHATNGRWLLMMREFCQIPESSAYFKPAKRSLEKWTALYGEDIAAAETAFSGENAQSCAVMP